MTLSEWADVSTIAASVTAVLALIYVAKQARDVGKQARAAERNYNLAEKQHKLTVDLAMKDHSMAMLLKYADPELLGHFRDAMRVAAARDRSPEEKIAIFNDRGSNFRFDLAVLSGYMELLASLKFAEYIDEKVTREFLYTPVTLTFRELRDSKLLETLRKEYPTALKLWEELVKEWEATGPPHQELKA